MGKFTIGCDLFLRHNYLCLRSRTVKYRCELEELDKREETKRNEIN
jgi:hypothetical protein